MTEPLTHERLQEIRDKVGFVIEGFHNVDTIMDMAAYVPEMLAEIDRLKALLEKTLDPVADERNQD